MSGPVYAVVKLLMILAADLRTPKNITYRVDNSTTVCFSVENCSTVLYAVQLTSPQENRLVIISLVLCTVRTHYMYIDVTESAGTDCRDPRVHQAPISTQKRL